MSAPGFTPVQLYRSTTASAVPSAGNLAAGELAINTTDEKLYFKNAGGTVKLLAANVTPAENGGTGQSSYTVGDLLYASGSTTLSKLADVAIGNALISGGVGVAPSWGKVGLTTHVSGTLPVANGGTGTATAFTSGSVVFAGASGVYSQDNSNLFWDDTNNRLGVRTATPAVSLAVSATDAILVPVGTTGERPTGATGYLRFNSTTISFEGYNGTAWGSIGGGATGGGTDQIFYLNGQTVNTSYSIPNGQNAGTFGPISVASGITVTVPSGSTWTVV